MPAIVFGQVPPRVWQRLRAAQEHVPFLSRRLFRSKDAEKGLDDRMSDSTFFAQLAQGSTCRLLAVLDGAFDELRSRRGVAEHQDFGPAPPAPQDDRAGFPNCRHGPCVIGLVRRERRASALKHGNSHPLVPAKQLAKKLRIVIPEARSAIRDPGASS